MPDETRNATSAVRVIQPAPPGDPARRARIATAAYYRAERRGFAPGREIEDWLEAERELDRGIGAEEVPGPDAEAPLTSEPAVPAGVPAKAKPRKSRGSTQRSSRR